MSSNASESEASETTHTYAKCVTLSPITPYSSPQMRQPLTFSLLDLKIMFFLRPQILDLSFQTACVVRRFLEKGIMMPSFNVVSALSPSYGTLLQKFRFAIRLFALCFLWRRDLFHPFCSKTVLTFALKRRADLKP